MNDDIRMLILLITAAIGLVTAIFLFKKAYIELKRLYSRKKSQSSDMEDEYMNKASTGSVKAKNSIVQSNTYNESGNTIIINQSHSHLENNDHIMDENIILKSTYTSLFAEKGTVQNEKIEIRNLGNGKIEGKVYLDKNYIYSLTGTFKNCILTGEFTSVGKYTYERGTINLKLISEDVLSGFCSFSKISRLTDDQIRMSPYVWVAGEDNNLLNGTYEFCTQCHNERKKCCCSSSDIDMPVLLYNEAHRIQGSNPRIHRMKVFSHSIRNTQVRQINESNSFGSEPFCYFYDRNENRCKIYNIRPTDCRLFPFDIKLDRETNEYWIGYYEDLCDRQLPDINVMKQYAHILRPQLFLLFPYANTINDESVCKRLSKASFVKLYKLEEFIF